MRSYSIQKGIEKDSSAERSRSTLPLLNYNSFLFFKNDLGINAKLRGF